MIIKDTDIQGLYLIELEVYEDDRGGFARVYCKKEFERIFFHKNFVQINHSYNDLKGTLRGLHFQYPPYSESKLIRCVRGRVNDVVVDIRKGSSTFLKHIKVELSAQNKIMILIPEGCAHGFQTLEDHTELIYHHTEFFLPNADGGLNYLDPKLNINWDIPVTKISKKDRDYQFLNQNFIGI